jgi:hypothetical protein
MKELLLWIGLWGFVALCAVIIPGCTSWNTLQSGIAVEGARAADEALETAEWGLCEATTMGAWQRRYGGNPDKAQAWSELCGKQVLMP